MPVSIQFDLDDSDLAHFRVLMEQACERTDCSASDSIIAAAVDVIERLRSSDTPGYVLQRIDVLETLVNMSRDEQWQLPVEESQRVSYALAYFADPADLIADDVPGLGYLDDAIMIDLVAHELRHEISAYQDFCDFRETEAAKRLADGHSRPEVTRCDWLDAKRAELQQRMRRESSRLSSLFSLFSSGPR